MKSSRRDSDKALSVNEAVLQRLGKRGPKFARAIIIVLSLFLVAAAAWSTIVQVPGLVRADGELTARGALRFVEHLEGGTVAEIMVAEGEVVQKNQVILRLSSHVLDIQLDQMAARINVVEETIHRLTTLSFDMPQDPTPESRLTRDRQSIHLQKTQQKLSVERKRIASQLIRERAVAIRTMRAIRDTAAKRLKGSDSRLSTYASLRAKGVISKIEFNRKEDERDTLEAEYLQAEMELSEAIASHADAENVYGELLLTEKEETLIALTEAYDLKTDLDLKRQELEHRRSKLLIRSPIDGVVQHVAIGVQDEVIEPGGRVAEILPTGVNLVAEIRLTPKDVGQVRLGDIVALSITTYPRNQYGQIFGQIASISPTSITEPNEEPFYKLMVKLDRQVIGLNGEQFPLRAGMLTQAELVTRSRSVAQYLLKPLDTTLSSALREK